jgi:hypothetical protein
MGPIPIGENIVAMGFPQVRRVIDSSKMTALNWMSRLKTKWL